MKLTSGAFAAGDAIPPVYTCDGDNVSPPLSWSEPPSAAKSLVLIVDDPDAPSGLFTHWMVYQIPIKIHQFDEGMPASETLPNGAHQGRNGFRKIGYGGPCPPKGMHRYFFRIFAVDSDLHLPAGASREQLDAALHGHVIDKGELMGTYRRHGK